MRNVEHNLDTRGSLDSPPNRRIGMTMVKIAQQKNSEQTRVFYLKILLYGHGVEQFLPLLQG